MKEKENLSPADRNSFVRLRGGSYVALRRGFLAGLKVALPRVSFPGCW